MSQIPELKDDDSEREGLVRVARLVGFGVALLFPFLVAAIAVGLWQGIELAKLGADTRWRTELLVMIPLICLLAIIPVLSRVGVYSRPASIPLGVLLVPLVGLVLLARLPVLPSLLRAIPAGWLVGVQVIRLGGAAFLIALASRQVGKPHFVLTAGVLDLVVGASALPVAWVLSTGSRAAVAVAIGWNVLGLFDFTLAVILSQIHGSGPFFLVHSQAPALKALRPGVLGIVAFGVPVAIILHALSLWQLIHP